VKSPGTAAWLGLAGVVAAQICYPLTQGGARVAVVATVVVGGFLLSTAHAAATRGARAAATLVVVAAGGGFLVEAAGLATGVPFGNYAYSDRLGPALAGVPLLVPLAWAFMAWPAWLAAGHLLARTVGRPPITPRILAAALALASWDLFLDPQMVAEGYWRWSGSGATLPGVAGVPLRNYAGWLAVAAVMMAALAIARAPLHRLDRHQDAPMLALYLWTYFSGVLAHAAFLDLPGSAMWGALGMGLIALPLAAALARRPAVPT
jgi:putative membrane protein